MQQDKSKQLRVFFGIPIPDDKAQMLQNLLIETNPKLKQQVRWTRPGNHHITLRFLGNIKEEKIENLIKFSSEFTNSINSFKVTLQSITLFPVQHGQLSAVTVMPSKELQSLYNALTSASSQLDFPKENRPYLPHITLFRSKQKKLIELKRVLLENEILNVNEYILYQSISIQGGSEYKPLHRFPLKA